MEKKFTWAESEQTGEMGWEIDGCGEVYDASNYAPGLAHDVLEHFELGTTEDEIEAHAAMYWLRYETGHSLRTPYGYSNMTLDNFSNEWTGLYQAASTEGGLNAAPEQEPLDDYLEEEISEIMEQGLKLLHDEHGEYLEERIADRLAEVYTNWFRLGYRKTQERYATLGAGHAVTVFDDVRQGFENLERDEKYGGERLTVTVDLETGDVSFEREQDWE